MPHTGKTALVTGAASGLGAAISRELSARGAVVLLADIDFQKVQETAREIGGVPIHLDVSNALQAETIVREIPTRYGALDLVINNAGIIANGEMLSFAPETWHRIFSVNLSGTIAISLCAYSVMRRQGFGHIINIGSLCGLIPVPFSGPYGTSKTALTGFTLALAAEAEHHGVHVSLVCPGNLNTGMARPKSPLPGVNPALAAQRIVNGIARNERIIVFPLYTRVLWWLERIDPGLIRLLNREIVRRHAKRVEQQETLRLRPVPEQLEPADTKLAPSSGGIPGVLAPRRIGQAAESSDSPPLSYGEDRDHVVQVLSKPEVTRRVS